jgi:WXXGXW repeat (2 copies)
MALRSRRSLGLMGAGLVASALLAGCIVVPAGGRHSGGGGGYGAPGPDVDDGPVVTVAPPIAQVDPMVPAPGVGYFWIGGHWTWQLGRHVWIGGRWAAPRPGYHWHPHRWVRHGSGWRESPGRWARR